MILTRVYIATIIRHIFYNVFFKNCLVYVTISTAFYKGRSIVGTSIHPQLF